MAVTFLRRSYAEHDDRSASPSHSDDGRGFNVLEGGQQRVPAVHAIYVKGPVKITGMSDSLSRQKIFICKPASAAEEPACARKIVANLAQKAFRRPVTDEDVNPLLKLLRQGPQGWPQLRRGHPRFAVGHPGEPAVPVSRRSRRGPGRPRAERPGTGLAPGLLHLEQPAG